MFGSAAISLVHVSKGSSEIYCEKNIMLWDVAAGLAIIEGSGGAYKIEETSKKWSYNVLATNGQFIWNKAFEIFFVLFNKIDYLFFSVKWNVI